MILFFQFIFSVEIKEWPFENSEEQIKYDYVENKDLSTQTPETKIKYENKKVTDENPVEQIRKDQYPICENKERGLKALEVFSNVLWKPTMENECFVNVLDKISETCELYTYDDIKNAYKIYLNKLFDCSHEIPRCGKNSIIFYDSVAINNAQYLNIKLGETSSKLIPLQDPIQKIAYAPFSGCEISIEQYERLPTIYLDEMTAQIDHIEFKYGDKFIKYPNDENPPALKESETFEKKAREANNDIKLIEYVDANDMDVEMLDNEEYPELDINEYPDLEDLKFSITHKREAKNLKTYKEFCDDCFNNNINCNVEILPVCQEIEQRYKNGHISEGRLTTFMDDEDFVINEQDEEDFYISEQDEEDFFINEQDEEEDLHNKEQEEEENLHNKEQDEEDFFISEQDEDLHRKEQVDDLLHINEQLYGIKHVIMQVDEDQHKKEQVIEDKHASEKANEKVQTDNFYIPDYEGTNPKSMTYKKHDCQYIKAGYYNCQGEVYKISNDVEDLLEQETGNHCTIPYYICFGTVVFFIIFCIISLYKVMKDYYKRRRNFKYGKPTEVSTEK